MLPHPHQGRRALAASLPVLTMVLALGGLPASVRNACALAAADAPGGAGDTAEGTSPWKWTPEVVVDLVGVGNVVLSPDGRTVLFTRSRWRSEEAKPGPAWSNVWRVPAAGGEPQPLTTADAEDTRPRWSPDGASIAFLSDRRAGGSNDEKPKKRIWIMPAAGGEPAPLTDEKTDVAAFEWSPDGRSIAFVAVDRRSEQKEKDEKAGRDAVVAEQDLRPRRMWIVDVGSKKAVALSALGELSAWDFDWAPDGSALVASVTDLNRTDDSYMKKRLVVLPLHGERRELVAVLGKVGPVAWSKDGRTVAWLGGSDASDPAVGSLFVVPARGGTPRNLTGDREETAQSLAWLPDGRIALCSVEGTRTGMALVDPATGAWKTVVPPGPASFTAAWFSEDGSRYAMVASSASHPADVFAGTLRGGHVVARRTGRDAGGDPALPTRITDSNPHVAVLPRGPQETIQYRARDGMRIEAVLIRPVGFVEGRRYPLVAIVHGGPESQYLDGWLNAPGSPGLALAERGYMVLFPNYRGSTGRGVAFSKADHGDLGGKEFLDVLDGIDHLASRGWVDPQRVGITGGSYGGYFTALGVTRYSDRFAAGVEVFGISSWESFFGQTDIPVEMTQVHWSLWCYEHPQLCRERSAIGNLDKARTPTLILQGADDPRVPRAQGDELHAALRWKRVPVEYVVYPREEHGFRERWHRLDALIRTLGWFERFLKPALP